MKIYVASSWKNEYQQLVVNILMAMGHEVYDFKHPKEGNDGFSWAQVDPNWEQWDNKDKKLALLHPMAEEGFKLDYDAMQWADTCVLVLPCGKSAHTEAGWMKGAGKQVIAFIPEEEQPELMYKLFDKILLKVDDLHHEFGRK